MPCAGGAERGATCPRPVLACSSLVGKLRAALLVSLHAFPRRGSPEAKRPATAVGMLVVLWDKLPAEDSVGRLCVEASMLRLLMRAPSGVPFLRGLALTLRPLQQAVEELADYEPGPDEEGEAEEVRRGLGGVYVWVGGWVGGGAAGAVCVFGVGGGAPYKHWGGEGGGDGMRKRRAGEGVEAKARRVGRQAAWLHGARLGGLHVPIRRKGALHTTRMCL